MRGYPQAGHRLAASRARCAPPPRRDTCGQPASCRFLCPLRGFALLRSRCREQYEGGPCGTFPRSRKMLRRGPHRAQFPSEFSLWEIASATPRGRRFRFPRRGRATLSAPSVRARSDRQPCQPPWSVFTLALVAVGPTYFGRSAALLGQLAAPHRAGRSVAARAASFEAAGAACDRRF